MRKSVATAGALSLVLLLIVPAAYVWGERAAIEERRRSAEQQLEIYALGLQSELSRYEYLPQVFAPNNDIVDLLDGQGSAGAVNRVNRYLQEVNRGARTAAIYVLDVHGVVRAASNWNEGVSFVGMDLSFRPYFADALAGRTGRFYGIGTTSGRPGYYFSQGISKGERLIGVAAVKVDLDRLEASWQGVRDVLLVTDGDGVILPFFAPGVEIQDPRAAFAVRVGAHYACAPVRTWLAAAALAICDGERLGQVLVNLFANAIDAMKGSAQPRLEIDVSERDEHVVIGVRDTGPGIPAEVADRLFEPFFSLTAEEFREQGADHG